MIQELDYQQTPLGELVLRCRRSPAVPDGLVYEVKLGDEMLMSSSVNASERALARLALDARGDRPSDVLVGGLGLGYTADAALDSPLVRRVDVIELLEPVIDWHRRRLVPAAERLMADGRCTLIHGDFFEHVAPADGSASQAPPYDAILLDIDHAPDSWLHPRHGSFYTGPRLARLVDRLRPGGVFALWSSDEPSPDFLALLNGPFASVRTDEVTFRNPHVHADDTNWIVVAGRG